MLQSFTKRSPTRRPLRLTGNGAATLGGDVATGDCVGFQLSSIDYRRGLVRPASFILWLRFGPLLIPFGTCRLHAHISRHSSSPLRKLLSSASYYRCFTIPKSCLPLILIACARICQERTLRESWHCRAASRTCCRPSGQRVPDPARSERDRALFRASDADRREVACSRLGAQFSLGLWCPLFSLQATVAQLRVT
jgi:hypothetical protein